MHDKLFVGVARLELHVPEARSLKAKRRQTRSLLERLRSRHQVLVIEAEGQDLYQRATFGLCALSTSAGDAETRLRRVESTIAESWAGNVLGFTIDVVEVD